MKVYIVLKENAFDKIIESVFKNEEDAKQLVKSCDFPGSGTLFWYEEREVIE